MSDDFTACMLAFIVILAPLWIVLHYTSKMRAGRKSSAADEAAYAQLNKTAARMEQRMAVLERILDAEVPNWRRDQNTGAL